MGDFGVSGLTAYNRFPPLSPLTDRWWVTHMRWVSALKPSRRPGANYKGKWKTYNMMKAREWRGLVWAPHSWKSKVGWDDTLVGGTVM